MNQKPVNRSRRRCSDILEMVRILAEYGNANVPLEFKSSNCSWGFWDLLLLAKPTWFMLKNDRGHEWHLKRPLSDFDNKYSDGYDAGPLKLFYGLD